MALISVTIYRFIESNLRAIQITTQQSSEAAAMQGLLASLQAQFYDLPTGRPGVLLGDAHRFGDKDADELQWICTAGNGMFTQFADGEYKITLALKPMPKTNTSELGLRRQRSSSEINNQLGFQPANWLRLIDNIDALEIRYFDQRLNAWLEKWTDQQTRPALIRIRIWRAGAETPSETILSLPMSRLPT